MRSRPATVGLLVLVLLGLASVAGPFFLPDPEFVNVRERLTAPSAIHLLGTDNLGRDLLSRVLRGGQVSFVVAIAATVFALLPSFVLGIGAAYYGGLVDEGLSRVFDVVLTFPALLLGIIFVAAIGPSPASLIIAVGIAFLPRYGRLIRALTLQVRQREYVLAALALGYDDLRVIRNHIFPNIIVPVLVIAAGNLGRAAIAEASLSFLGVGIQPPAPSWGNIIADSQPYLRYYPMFALVPAIFLSTATVAFAFVGDGLRDAFDVREPAVSQP
jgi:peptide/nickel transport system permease protein